MCTPGERATDDRLSAFIAELRARVAPVSAAMMVGALVRMLSVLEPERDWAPLARVYNHPLAALNKMLEDAGKPKPGKK